MRDPFLHVAVAWPKGIDARGEIRHQYCHAIDIVPTLYECLGIDPPDVVHGYTQSEVQGVSFAHTFDDGAAPTKKAAQFYSMLGTRGIWQGGWHAAAVHPATSGWGGFEKGRWELFHLDEDRSQCRDLAAQHPDKLEHLKAVWAFLAGKYQALPLDDRTPVEKLGEARPRPGKPRDQYVFTRTASRSPRGWRSPLGAARLFIDGRQVAEDHIKTQPGFFGLEGVVTVGRDTGRPASDDYRSPSPFRGGVVEKVTVAVRGQAFSDPQAEAEMAARRD